MRIKQLMQDASEAYYDGVPFLTNEQYDSLERLHGQIISGNGEVPHAYRMYSLRKHYAKDGEAPLSGETCVSSLKLDGAAISLLYVSGELVSALTRGNGVKGKNVLEKLINLNIPENIKTKGIVQITGEVVAHKDMPNSRNYASGALNLKDLNDFKQRVEQGSMKFIAYNIQNEKDVWGVEETYSEDIALLKASGFTTIDSSLSDYPTDGTVYRIDNNNKFNELGFTDKFPRGAYAFKEEQETVTTTLLDVIWQTGKSGKVSPVAILEPIQIDGATISRATLNNMSFIKALNLELGCKVNVIRSGEIIPCIVSRAD